jgi:hypothetical protein
LGGRWSVDLLQHETNIIAMPNKEPIDPIDALLDLTGVPREVVEEPAEGPPASPLTIPKATLTASEIAHHFPRRDRPLTGLALRVHEHLAQWVLTLPPGSVLSFVDLAHTLGVSTDALRGVRHKHKALSRSLAAMGLEEVGRSSGRMLGYRLRHVRQT